MDQRQFIILFCCIFFQVTQSYAAPIMYREQQQKAMKQQQEQAQGMTQEQYQQYLLYQEQQQGDHQAPAPPTYQETIDQRNQAIAQSIRSAHNQTGSSNDQALTGAQAEESSSSAVAQQTPAAARASDSQDVVDLSEVWKKLDKKSTVWSAMTDDQAKLLTVSEYIGRYQKEGVKINQTPTQYVQMIDQIAEGNPQMLQRPFGELLQIVAIINYDFDNGMDKDALAKQILGEAGYETNKQRFIQQQQAQQQPQK